MGNTDPVTDHTARTHDYNLFKSLLDSLTDPAQSRLLGIISNKKRLVTSLPRSVSRHRAYSAADPAHPHAVTQQETSTNTYTEIARPESRRASPWTLPTPAVLVQAPHTLGGAYWIQ